MISVYMFMVNVAGESLRIFRLKIVNVFLVKTLPLSADVSTLQVVLVQDEVTGIHRSLLVSLFSMM